MVSGGFAYKGLFLMQNDNAADAFKTLLETHRPSKVLEIGTFHGGLAMLLRDTLDSVGLQDTWIRTYDTAEQKFLKPRVEKENLKIDVQTKNLFSYSYLEWKDETTKNEIKDFVDSGSPTLVLCDGGCKRCEFNLIAPLLRPGDVIMAHDYAPDQDVFDREIKDKIWNWLEIQDKNINATAREHSLVPYHQEMMQKAAWLCKIKDQTD